MADLKTASDVVRDIFARCDRDEEWCLTMVEVIEARDREVAARALADVYAEMRYACRNLSKPPASLMLKVVRERATAIRKTQTGETT